MKVLRIILTAFFSIFAAIGLGSVLLGKLSPYSLIVVFLYLAVAAALNSRGGKPTRITAFIISILFIVCGLLSLAMFVSTFFGQAYDAVTPVAFAIFGAIGALTFASLKKQAV